MQGDLRHGRGGRGSFEVVLGKDDETVEAEVVLGNVHDRASLLQVIHKGVLLVPRSDALLYKIEEFKRLLVYRELLVSELPRFHSQRGPSPADDRPTIENFAANYNDPDYLVHFAEN